MIIVAGHLRVAAGERDQYLAGVADVASQHAGHPGARLRQSADPIDPERINIYERWEDDDAL